MKKLIPNSWFLVMALICAAITGAALKARDYSTVVLASGCMVVFAVGLTRREK